MFRDDIQNEFDACFHVLGVNPDDIVGTTGWYSIAQWVLQVNGGQDVRQVSIEDCFKMEWFRRALSAFCLYRYPIRQNADALFRLCEVIRCWRLVGCNAKIFFQCYLPSVVGNTSYFAWNEVKSDGALTSSVIYLVMLCAGNRLGSAEVLELVVKEEFGKVEKQLVQFGITFNEFNLCWNAVHYIDASNPFQSKPKIKKALKAYEKMNLPGTVLLEQYAHARNYNTSDWKYGLNPWEYVQHKLGIGHQERGMSADEKLFNEAVYKILKESPSDVIQTVFYRGRDDSLIECAVARTEVKLRLMSAHNVLVVNPSPMFLRLFCENMDALTRNSNIDHKIPATFVVTDRIVKELYAREHSYFKFVEMSELQSIDQMFDYVVVLARDYKSLPLWDALDRCSERANFTLLLPQTVLTQQEEHFAEELRKRNLAVNWIMDVPQKCCQSTPRKKMLVSGTKQKEYFNPKMHLIFTDSDESGSHIIPQKANITVPTAMLSRNLTLAQMRSLVSQGDKLPQPRLFETYDFSREIKICYNWIRDAEGNLVKARAYYRKFLRPDEESHRQKGKRPNDKRTERGLRGKTEEEIIPKLEGVPLYVEFFDDIVEDILEVYAGRYLKDLNGFTDDDLAEMPVFLEKERRGRGKRKLEMISRKTAQRVNKALLSVAQIAADKIRLLEGEAAFNYNMNDYSSDLYSLNFRHKANIICSFSEGELFHYLGNKTSDTYARHYCNNDIDTLVYADAGKINRWAYRYDPRNTETENRRIMELHKEDGTVTTGRYLEGVANADLTLTASEHAVGYIEIEVDCAHGVEIDICDY